MVICFQDVVVVGTKPACSVLFMKCSDETGAFSARQKRYMVTRPKRFPAPSALFCPKNKCHVGMHSKKWKYCKTILKEEQSHKQLLGLFPHGIYNTPKTRSEMCSRLTVTENHRTVINRQILYMGGCCYTAI